MSWLMPLLILSFLIFFHELGHFLAARFFGVRVDVFSIGFGKRLFTIRRGDTDYSLSMIPLGGYVKMKGQDDTNPALKSYDEDSYNAKTPMQRIVILLAGPFANFLLAFILYFVIAIAGHSTLAPVIGKIIENSPAQIAKLQEGDKIIEIGTKQIVTWDDMAKEIKSSTGTINLVIERKNALYPIVLTPKNLDTENMFNEKIKKRMIGIAPLGDTIEVQSNPIEALNFAYIQTIKASTLIVQSLQKLIQGIVPAKELGGVVSIVQVTHQAAESGIIALLFFTALISVNLGVLNLLPIPALDGGHIMFNIYEFITRKVPSEDMLIRLTVGGWVFLIALMSLGLYNDIVRIVNG